MRHSRIVVKTLTESQVRDLCSVQDRDPEDLSSVLAAIRKRFGGFLRRFYEEVSPLGVRRGYFEVQLIPNRKGRLFPDARAASSR